MINRLVKRMLIGLGIGVVLTLIILVGIVVFMFTKSGKESDQRIHEQQRQGSEFGKTADQKGCIKEGLTRGSKIALLDISGAVANDYFVKGCLQTSRATPGFCNGVPSDFENVFSKWTEKKCDTVDIPGPHCEGVFKEQIDFCHR